MESQTEEVKGISPQNQSRDLEFWEKRAPAFADHSRKTHYSNEFLKLMQPMPDWTVFDMACGGGTLAIPLASKVKRITAVDFSRNMLSILERHCRENHITNIDIIRGEWDEDWKSLGIGEHDVAIASRSLRAENAAHYIQKLNQVARRRVYISAPVGNGPLDTRLLDFVGRKTAMNSDYIDFYNILHGMGIRANVAFIEENHNKQWRTFEEALEDQRWMLFDITEAEEEKTRLFLGQNLIHRDGYFQLSYERKCQWAVMWWTKE